MNNKQYAIVQYQLHQENNSNLNHSLEEKLKFFNLNEEEKERYKEKIKNSYKNGIKALNKNQLLNIIDKISVSRYDEDSIKSRLKFYEIDMLYYSEILNFLKDYSSLNIAIDVSNIDENFKGVQVASRDDFNTIINQGYTGDWVLSPNSITHNFVQVASMNETGRFPRGNYLNAEITKIEPVKYDSQTRYRIHIKNPIVIDSGNRNVKFKMNPVTYIS